MLNNFLLEHKKRIVGLDIIRSVAILCVVFNHGKQFIPKAMRETYFKFKLINLDGVTVFFVLSGFLIGRILLKNFNLETLNFKTLFNFWIRRWFRTLPNYYFVLFLILIWYSLFSLDLSNFSYKYFLFIQNFAAPHPLFFREAWSLSIEEWFYLLFPFLFFLLFKISKRKSFAFLTIGLIFIIMPLVLRIFKFETMPPEASFGREIQQVLIYRLDNIMYGIIAAYAVFYNAAFWEKSKKIALTLGIIILVLIYFDLRFYIYKPLSFNIDSICTLLFLPFLSNLKTTGLKLFDATFIFISIISYSMYLLNLHVVSSIIIPVINYLTGLSKVSPNYNICNYILFWFLTIGLSFLLYRFYEKPMTNLREKLS